MISFRKGEGCAGPTLNYNVSNGEVRTCEFGDNFESANVMVGILLSHIDNLVSVLAEERHDSKYRDEVLAQWSRVYNFLTSQGFETGYMTTPTNEANEVIGWIKRQFGDLEVLKDRCVSQSEMINSLNERVKPWVCDFVVFLRKSGYSVKHLSNGEVDVPAAIEWIREQISHVKVPNQEVKILINERNALLKCVDHWFNSAQAHEAKLQEIRLGYEKLGEEIEDMDISHQEAIDDKDIEIESLREEIESLKNIREEDRTNSELECKLCNRIYTALVDMGLFRNIHESIAFTDYMDSDDRVDFILAYIRHHVKK